MVNRARWAANASAVPLDRDGHKPRDLSERPAPDVPEARRRIDAIVTWRRLHDAAKEESWRALRESLTDCFRVLLYPGSSDPPSLHLVTAEDNSAARAVADELLAEAPDGVGVEVWRDDHRIYARGATPARNLDQKPALLG